MVHAHSVYSVVIRWQVDTGTGFDVRDVSVRPPAGAGKQTGRRKQAARQTDGQGGSEAVSAGQGGGV